METRNGLGFRIQFGKYLQELLTAVASIFLAFFLQFVGWTFHGWSASSQTGLTAVAGGPAGICVVRLVSGQRLFPVFPGSTPPNARAEGA